jgi:hypothetical protein
MTRTGLLALPVLLAALVNTSAADDRDVSETWSFSRKG